MNTNIQRDSQIYFSVPLINLHTLSWKFSVGVIFKKISQGKRWCYNQHNTRKTGNISLKKMDERKFDFSGSLSKILVPVIIIFLHSIFSNYRLHDFSFTFPRCYRCLDSSFLSHSYTIESFVCKMLSSDPLTYDLNGFRHLFLILLNQFCFVLSIFVFFSFL